MKRAPPGSVAYEAHSERPITGKELLWASEHFREIAAGRGTWQPLCIDGVPTRQLGTGDFNVILPGEFGQRLKPFPSLTTEVDPVAGPCPAHQGHSAPGTTDASASVERAAPTDADRPSRYQFWSPR